MLAAASSGTGKTTISLALNRALRNRGLQLAPFKTGPDFIDPMFHALAAGRPCGNLDLYMQAEEGMRLALGLNPGELSIMEGAMGYFDGLGSSFEASSYDIARRLCIPTLLIYAPDGEMFTMVPKLKGMVDFACGQVVGILLNRTSSRSYSMIKGEIERHCKVPVLGFLPKSAEIGVPSRYLGLLQPQEIQGVEEKIERAAELLEKYIDVTQLIEIAGGVEPVIIKGHRQSQRLRIAVAKDEAFSFHYNENLRLFEEFGRLEFFSPLRDAALPECDFLFLGGGYPELFSEQLSQNHSMRTSILKFSQGGGHILGMGGGLMYLSRTLDGHPMVGALDTVAQMTEVTQRFGYVQMESTGQTILGGEGLLLRGKEFHRSKVETQMTPVLSITRQSTGERYACGYSARNTLGMYPHINFAGAAVVLEELMKRVEGRNVH